MVEELAVRSCWLLPVEIVVPFDGGTYDSEPHSTIKADSTLGCIMQLNATQNDAPSNSFKPSQYTLGI
jgi:hypothetical protein